MREFSATPTKFIISDRNEDLWRLDRSMRRKSYSGRENPELVNESSPRADQVPPAEPNSRQFPKVDPRPSAGPESRHLPNAYPRPPAEAGRKR